MATTDDYKAYAVAAAKREGIPVNMFLWQIGKESAWNPNAQNANSTAGGIAQFVDGTAKEFGINKFNPYQSIDAAAKYDRQLYEKTGSWEKALTSYGTLHGADAKTMGEFQNALGGNVETKSTFGSISDSVMDGVKQLWNNSAFGLAGDTYDNLANGGANQTGEWDFVKKLTGNTAIIVLGIVVIALAVLSNKSVQGVAAKAIGK